MTRTAFFTICARNFLAYARNLHTQLRRHHPDCDFYVFLSDESGGFDHDSLEFPFVPIEALNIDKIEDMKWYYNITEFCTALKPFAFSYLFSRDYDRVVYFDPDILVLSPLKELFQTFDEGASCVLTPHLTAARPAGEIDDLRLLQLGTFNLGFCGLQKTEETLELVSWWGWRLRTHSLIDLEHGLFVDQKWADLFPSFVAEFRSLRHPGYNLAYWNLHQRRVATDGTSYLANGLPLRFVHFSGFDIRDRSKLTRHIGNTERSRIGALADLMDRYADGVLSEGHEAYADIPYAFSWNGARGQNLHTPERVRGKTLPGPRITDRMRKLRSAAYGVGVAVNRHGLRPDLARRALRHVRLRGVLDLLRHLASLDDRDRRLLEARGGRSPSRAAKVAIRRVLFVDWGLPNPTTDAGGLFSFEIVMGLRAMGLEVTILPLEWRVGEHRDHYDDTGVSIADVNAWAGARAFIEGTAGRYDALVLNRGPAVVPVLDEILRSYPHAPLILNTHDLHYLREEREADVSGDAFAARRAAKTKKDELAAIGKVDAVWLVSEHETYVLAGEDDDAPVLLQPLVVEGSVDGPLSSEGRDSLVFVGSFDHAPNVDAMQHFVSGVWPKLHEAYPSLQLKIIGKNAPASLDWIRKVHGVAVLGHVDDLEPHFNEALASIAPLRFGAGIKGKLLTSWSFGVPVIGSPIAAEGLPGAWGEAFLQAGSQGDFVEAISTLVRPAQWQVASDASLAYLRQHFSRNRLRRALEDLLNGFAVGNGPIPNRHELQDYDAYVRHERMSEHIWRKRRQHERELVDKSDELIHTAGYCAVCGQDTTFVTSYQWSSTTYDDGRDEPNWREHVACSRCGLVTRLRATIHHLQTTSLRRNSRVYLTERVTPFYSFMAQRVDDIVGSEYLGPNLAPGQMVNGVRHEDLQGLSFPDQSFDLIVSLDVLEHVPDFRSAFGELYRCLKPGGRVVIAVPFAQRSAENVVRAELLPDGSLVHHLPPEYHGNPVDHEGGSLCYRYYGWEMLDYARSIGFSKAAAYSYWSKRYQYLGTENWIFEFVR